MKTSLVTTIFNEEKSIEEFLIGLMRLSIKPDEVIIVDGGSTDNTLSVISNFKSQISKKMKTSQIKVYTKKGNRSVGRNEGVEHAKGEIILFTDAGCLLDKNWVKEIVKPFRDHSTDVVAGYYAARTETVFQKCLAPYALVMPDRVNPDSFLPATRSMAIRKNVFVEMGGFDLKYSHNEDYVFARKLLQGRKKIVFTPKAIVYWIPRRTFQEAYVMFWRFAYGDAEAGIVRPKVIFLFSRYILALFIAVAFVLTKQRTFLFVLSIGFVLYWIWAVQKNYRYVKDIRAFYLLPLIQFVADKAVIIGSLQGFLKKYGL